MSIGIVTNEHRPIENHWKASEIASEMKNFAKRITGSSYAIDRRVPGDSTSDYDTSEQMPPG